MASWGAASGGQRAKPFGNPIGFESVAVLGMGHRHAVMALGNGLISGLRQRTADRKVDSGLERGLAGAANGGHPLAAEASPPPPADKNSGRWPESEQAVEKGRQVHVPQVFRQGDVGQASGQGFPVMPAALEQGLQPGDVPAAEELPENAGIRISPSATSRWISTTPPGVRLVLTKP